MRNFLKFSASVIGCEMVGLLGTPFTISAIPNWYTGLNKPFFSPPNWIFGPVWTVLYFLMGVAFFVIWNRGWQKKQVKTAIRFFMVQLVLNFVWSPVFFGLQSPAVGLLVIVAMWVAIVLTMQRFYNISKLAFYLLVPYLLWVSFATLLNAAILILN